MQNLFRGRPAGPSIDALGAPLPLTVRPRAKGSRYRGQAYFGALFAALESAINANAVPYGLW